MGNNNFCDPKQYLIPSDERLPAERRDELLPVTFIPKVSPSWFLTTRFNHQTVFHVVPSSSRAGSLQPLNINCLSPSWSSYCIPAPCGAFQLDGDKRGQDRNHIQSCTKDGHKEHTPCAFLVEGNTVCSSRWESVCIRVKCRNSLLETKELYLHLSSSRTIQNQKSMCCNYV